MLSAYLKCGFIVVLVLATTGVLSRASEEDFLPWQSLDLDFGSHAEAGRVALSANVRDARISNLTIVAFGSEYKLTADELERLRGFGLESLRTTQEAGYSRTGGRTIYFKLRRIFYSASDKAAIEEEVVVSVNRGRGLSLSGPTRRN
jgi:hypothetical protein